MTTHIYHLILLKVRNLKWTQGLRSGHCRAGFPLQGLRKEALCCLFQLLVACFFGLKPLPLSSKLIAVISASTKASPAPGFQGYAGSGGSKWFSVYIESWNECRAWDSTRKESEGADPSWPWRHPAARLLGETMTLAPGNYNKIWSSKMGGCVRRHGSAQWGPLVKSDVNSKWIIITVNCSSLNKIGSHASLWTSTDRVKILCFLMLMSI